MGICGLSGIDLSYYGHVFGGRNPIISFTKKKKIKREKLFVFGWEGDGERGFQRMINQNFGYILNAMLENMMIYQSKFTLCVLNFVS